MTETARFVFKIADLPEEIEAIHRLNHRTFAGEIPQHQPSPSGILIDKFHGQNIYIIALASGRLAGMVALRLMRPFSLDARVPDLDSYLPLGRRWCEVRLLVVEKGFRGTPIMAGLLRKLAETVAANGHDAAVISATTRQLKLYRHFGFCPFGPLVGTDEASFQPMYLAMETFESEAPALSRRFRKPVILLPGPVAIPEHVTRAFTRMAISHRSPEMIAAVQSVRRSLCQLTGALHAQLMPGSGTLANEAVCGQISLLQAPGMVVSCGEFGERLADHARCSGLPHEHVALPWGQGIDIPSLAARLERHPEIRWLWTTHCETSTGALTDLAALRTLCAQRNIRLAIDAVSTLGVIPVDLTGVWMAASASGKGLASYPGIAIVFHNEHLAPALANIPRYLDLGLYASGDGIPFTISSNLIAALKASLEGTNWPVRMANVERLHALALSRLLDMGQVIACCDVLKSPAVITLLIPEDIDAVALADRLATAGVQLSCRSAYLMKRNWLQACFMGDLAIPDIDYFLTTMAAI